MHKILHPNNTTNAITGTAIDVRALVGNNSIRNTMAVIIYDRSDLS